jgi:hypothetical protein
VFDTEIALERRGRIHLRLPPAGVHAAVREQPVEQAESAVSRIPAISSRSHSAQAGGLGGGHALDHACPQRR